MKKFLMIALALAMVLATAIPCFAAVPGNETGDVKVTYAPGAGAETVYSVDVSFGAMTFTYTDASKGTWNPETHAYDGIVAAAWTCAENANKVTVTNDSDAAVKVTVTYAAKSGFEAINGAVENDSFTLPSAVGKAADAAELTASATLTLSGALDSETEAGTVAGTVTVAFAAA